MLSPAEVNPEVFVYPLGAVRFGWCERHSNQSQKCNIVIVTFHWFETLSLLVLVTSEPVARLLLKYGRKETGS